MNELITEHKARSTNEIQIFTAFVVVARGLIFTLPSIFLGLLDHAI